MKNYILLLAAALALAACSTPKYTYYFDHHDYNSGKKQPVTAVVTQEVQSPLQLDVNELTADTKVTPALPEKQNIQVIKKALSEKMATMTKEEKKEFRKALTSELKNVAKAKKKSDNVETTAAKQAWDYDLKMAAIFGAVGLVLTALGGVNTVFWVLGAISLIVGLVFLIKWLSRQ